MLAHLGFLILECGRNLRRQGLMALACVSTAAVALSIFGVFLVLTLQVRSIVDSIPDRFEAHVFLRTDATRAQTEALADELRAMPGVARVRMVTREEAWSAMRKSYPHPEDLDGLNTNPLPDKLEVTCATPQRTLEFAEQARNLSLVHDVRDGREVLRRLLAIAGMLRVGGTILAVLLALGTAAVVSNAIRMTLFARRRDIRVMQLVGATDSFIRLPFVLEGMLVGAAGGALACGALAAGVHYVATHVVPNVPFINEFRLTVPIPPLCAALVLGGALLGVLGSMVSLRRFLRLA